MEVYPAKGKKIAVDQSMYKGISFNLYVPEKSTVFCLGGHPVLNVLAETQTQDSRFLRNASCMQCKTFNNNNYIVASLINHQ